MKGVLRDTVFVKSYFEEMELLRIAKVWDPARFVIKVLKIM